MACIEVPSKIEELTKINITKIKTNIEQKTKEIDTVQTINLNE